MSFKTERAGSFIDSRVAFFYDKNCDQKSLFPNSPTEASVTLAQNNGISSFRLRCFQAPSTSSKLRVLADAPIANGCCVTLTAEDGTTVDHCTVTPNQCHSLLGSYNGHLEFADMYFVAPPYDSSKISYYSDTASDR